jgi:hypothetical protein
MARSAVEEEYDDDDDNTMTSNNYLPRIPDLIPPSNWGKII